MQLHGLNLDLTGWFQVAWSGDIGQEQVVPLRYFGRDLVAYRGRDGVVRVHDRWHWRWRLLRGASLAEGHWRVAWSTTADRQCRPAFDG